MVAGLSNGENKPLNIHTYLVKAANGVHSESKEQVQAQEADTALTAYITGVCNIGLNVTAPVVEDL